MTRQENMIKVNKKKYEQNKKDVKHFISGMFSEEYKKPNGTWNKTKLKERLKLSRVTITAAAFSACSASRSVGFDISPRNASFPSSNASCTCFGELSIITYEIPSSSKCCTTIFPRILYPHTIT